MLRRSGFTLIELLVVIGIIAILSGVILAALSASRDAANYAKAKEEMRQVIVAAEIVYSEYGYYPPDSHSSDAICPKNIPIDDSGNFFSKYVGALCDDPWGNHYVWNNYCAGGTLGSASNRREYDGSGACPRFADTSPGPVGVTVLGPDGATEGLLVSKCDGDNLCNGVRGHDVYDGTGAEPPLGGSSCSGIDSCSSIGVGSCTGRSGCSVTGAACNGTYSENCSALTGVTDQTSCENYPGCSWQSGSPSCSGSPSSCSSYGSSGSCTGAGCTWGVCGSSPTACASADTNAQCNGAATGCSWTACSGTNSVNCSQWNNNQTSCNANSATCNYNTGTGACSKKLCGTQTSATACRAIPGCNTGTVGCSGTPTSCSTRSQTSCVNGCSWQATSCGGTPSVCSTYNSNGTSCTNAGCSYNGGTGTCTLTTTLTCAPHTSGESACEVHVGCTFEDSACGSTPTAACSTYGESACGTQTGCAWI